MMASPLPETTLAVILGARTFPKAPNFSSSEAFGRSAEGFRDYLLSNEGFGLPQDNLLYLFDSPESFSTLDETIVNFLKGRANELQERNTPVRDVIIYYVGHGGFSSDGSEYFLAIRDTRDGNEYYTSYAIKALARTLKEQARSLRKYLILDSCFAAAAYTAFQSPPLESARQKIMDEFPERGTALLCASGPREPAKAPQNQPYTMFSGALLDVLNDGSAEESEWFSLSAMGEIVRARIRELYEDDAVRPQVLSPDQRQGEVSGLPLFPNPALRMKGILASIRRLETDIVEVCQTQAKHDTLYKELAERLHSLENSAPAIGQGSVKVGISEIGTEKFNPGKQFGLTLQEWNSIPPDFRIMIRDYRIKIISGAVWMAVCFIICVLSLLGLSNIQNDSLSALARFAFTLCAIMAVISFAFIPMNKLLGFSSSFRAGEYPDAAWQSYDIVALVKNFKSISLLPGFEISISIWARCLFAYSLTVISILAIRFDILSRFI